MSGRRGGTDSMFPKKEKKRRASAALQSSLAPIQNERTLSIKYIVKQSSIEKFSTEKMFWTSRQLQPLLHHTGCVEDLSNVMGPTIRFCHEEFNLLYFCLGYTLFVLWKCISGLETLLARILSTEICHSSIQWGQRVLSKEVTGQVWTV